MCPLSILVQAMVVWSVSLVFLLVLGKGESELDDKISPRGKATEWGDPDLSLPESCQPAPSCKECILSHPSCAWCKQLVKMGLQPLSHVSVCALPRCTYVAVWAYMCFFWVHCSLRYN